MFYIKKEKEILHNIKHNLNKLGNNYEYIKSIDMYKTQERLLLFNHVNKCRNYTSCYLGKICNVTRNILEHVLCCNNRKCNVQYCKSSKIMLNHHFVCRNIYCVSCEPCREIYDPIYCELNDAADILCKFIEK
jgi:hypothetical protein